MAFSKRSDRLKLMTCADQLRAPKARGQLLHAFANHELLALELMALMLLRFPKAPGPWRRGLAGIMIDEQRHMKLYLERMDKLGITFGEAPISGFFWSCLSECRSPTEFNFAMSMTLEQANLDFLQHYHRLFSEAGDGVTAAILSQVYEDEISHLSHGVTWAKKAIAEKSQQNLFKSHQAALRVPLTLARAKGPGFDRSGRIRAHLPDSYCDELQRYRGSKDRRASLYVFNPTTELEAEYGVVGRTIPKQLQHLASDLAPLMGLVASEHDAVLVPKPVGPKVKRTWLDLGLKLPKFVTLEAASTLNAQQLVPWGTAPSMEKLANDLNIDSPRHAFPGFDKSFWWRLWKWDELMVSSESALADRIKKLHLSGHRRVVIKSPYGAAGRGLVRSVDGCLGQTRRQWAAAILQRHGTLLVEPWLENGYNLSVLIDTRKKNPIGPIMGFLTDHRGQYIGHCLGDSFAHFKPKDRQEFFSQSLHNQLRASARRTAEQLRRLGYRGPAGIDALVYRDSDILQLKTPLEINCRHTMGHLASGLAKQLGRQFQGLFLIQPNLATFLKQASSSGVTGDIYPLNEGAQIGAYLIKGFRLLDEIDHQSGNSQ